MQRSALVVHAACNQSKRRAERAPPLIAGVRPQLEVAAVLMRVRVKPRARISKLVGMPNGMWQAESNHRLLTAKPMRN